MTSKMPGGKPEKKLISLRLPLPLLTEMDEFAWKNRTDRSDVIESACRFYVSAVICPVCGTLNAKNSKRCSICGVNLDSLEEWKNRLHESCGELCDLKDRLIGLQTQLEKSSLSLDRVMDSETVEEADKKYLRMQNGATELLLKKITTVLSDNAKLSANIQRAKTIQNDTSAELPDIVGILNLINADVAEIEYLCDYANDTLSYNKDMLNLHDT